MIVFNKNPTMRNRTRICLPILKDTRRINTIKRNKISKDNKLFLKSLGLILKNASNHRFASS